MNKDKILKELHEKVNAWFEEKPQRPIAQFMLDTMLPYIEAVEHSVQADLPIDKTNNQGVCTSA